MVLAKLETELKLRGFSKETISAYLMYNRLFLDFIRKDPTTVDEDDIKKYIAYLISEKNYKPASRSLALSALRFLYKKVIKKDVTAKLEYPKQDDNIPTVLTKKEIKDLFNAIKNDKHRLILELLFSSGIRVSECVSLKKIDINFEENTITVIRGKGRKGRITILSKDVAKSLHKYISTREDNNPFIFPSGDSHISVKLVQKIIKQAAKLAGIERNVFCHALRSTFATHLLNKGVDIRIIQELLGHSKLSTTQKYTKVSTEQIRKIKSPFDDL